MTHLARYAIALLLLVCPGLTAGASVKVELAGKIFNVDTAVTPSEWAKGLQHRTHLDTHAGMLFIYPKAHQLSFWMKDTLLALDILFFDATGALLNIHHNVQPCRAPPCTIYSSHGPAQYVLEFNAGTAKALGARSGDKFTILP